MQYIKDCEQYNEGMKTWLVTFSLLLSLGIVKPSQAEQLTNNDKKEIVSNIDKKDSTILEFIDKTPVDTLAEMDKAWGDFKMKDESTKNMATIDLINYINKSTFPMNVNFYRFSTDDKTTDINLLKIEYPINSDIKVNFTRTTIFGIPNSGVNSLGLSYKF